MLQNKTNNDLSFVGFANPTPVVILFWNRDNDFCNKLLKFVSFARYWC